MITLAAIVGLIIGFYIRPHFSHGPDARYWTKDLITQVRICGTPRKGLSIGSELADDLRVKRCKLAIEALSNAESVDSSLYAALLVAIEDEDSGVAHAAYRCLIKHGDFALPYLTLALQTNPISTRLNIVYVLGGQTNRMVIAALESALENESTEVRREACRCLAKHAHEITATGMRLLQTNLMNEDPALRLRSAVVLVGADPSAERVKDILFDLSKQANSEDLSLAIAAFRGAGSNQFLERLKQYFVRMAQDIQTVKVIESQWQLERPNLSDIRLILNIATNESSNARMLALDSLRLAGPAAVGILPDLRACKERSTGPIRDKLIVTIGQIEDRSQ